MNIEISTKEYRDLLDILHIADVIMSGHGEKRTSALSSTACLSRSSMPSHGKKVLIG
jgi:hypothetical protein